MAGNPLTQYYVDPSLGTDTGDGSVSTPWGRASGSVLQYALDTITRDTSNGDQINVKAGADDVLSSSLSLSTYGTPSVTAPLIIRGYTSEANDGGRGSLDGGGSYGMFSTGAGCALIDMIIHDMTGHGARCGTVLGCEIYNCSGGIYTGSDGVFIGNNIFECSGYGINVQSSATVVGNYLKDGTTNTFSGAALYVDRPVTVSGNIIVVSGGRDGIRLAYDGAGCMNNSILSLGGTGQGVSVESNRWGHVILNNLIEGFSGVGGYAIQLTGTTEAVLVLAGNSYYNCAGTVQGDTNSEHLFDELNETLSASPFAKQGANSFANRFNYFRPVDLGNVLKGAYPYAS